MRVKPVLIDDVNCIWKVDGQLTAVYDRNGLGEDISVEFSVDKNETIFHLPYFPYGEVTCDVE